MDYGFINNKHSLTMAVASVHGKEEPQWTMEGTQS